MRTPAGQAEPQTLYGSRRIWGWWTAGAFALGLVCAVPLCIAVGWPGLVAMVPFLPFITLGLLRLDRRLCRLELSSAGLTERRMGRNHFIPWADIEGLKINPGAGIAMVGIKRRAGSSASYSPAGSWDYPLWDTYGMPAAALCELLWQYQQRVLHGTGHAPVGLEENTPPAQKASRWAAAPWIACTPDALRTASDTRSADMLGEGPAIPRVAEYRCAPRTTVWMLAIFTVPFAFIAWAGSARVMTGWPQFIPPLLLVLGMGVLAWVRTSPRFFRLRFSSRGLEETCYGRTTVIPWEEIRLVAKFDRAPDEKLGLLLMPDAQTYPGRARNSLDFVLCDPFGKSADDLSREIWDYRTAVLHSRRDVWGSRA